MKKLIYSIIFIFTMANSVIAADVIVSPFGYLNGLFKIHNGSSIAGLGARSGAHFTFEYGFSGGIGAIGAWAKDMKSGLDTQESFLSTGDVSDAFLRYDANERLSIAAGRFNSDFMQMDWVAGNIQGLAARYALDNFNFYITYINSYLDTGYKRGLVGSKYGTGIHTLQAYFPGVKKAYVGGEVLSGGINFLYKGFGVDVYGLVNTKLPGDVAHWNNATTPTIPSFKKNALLWQAGAKVGYEFITTHDIQSTTILRGLVQYGNTDERDLNKNGENLSILMWLDQKFVFDKIYYFGGGMYSVIGKQSTGGIWSINDRTRFYGRYISPYGSLYSAHFANSTLSAYLFGGLDFNGITIQALASFIDYQELSIMAQYNIWTQKNLALDVGGGLINLRTDRFPIGPTQDTRSKKEGITNFNAFVRFSY